MTVIGSEMTAEQRALLVSERALDAACGAVHLDISSAGAKRYRNALEAAAPIIIGEFLEELSSGLSDAAKGLQE